MPDQNKSQQAFLGDVIASLDEQPLPLGPVAQTVIRLTTDPMVSTDRLARAVSADAGLAAAIIKKVNSCYYGGTERIGSLPQAIARLGSLTTRSIAVSASLRSMYRFGDDAGIEEYLWRHSVAVALASRLIAHRAKDIFAEEAYLCGLLHDVAKMVLVQRFYNQYYPILRDVGLMIGHHLQVECDHLGFSHADLGAMILERWQFAPLQVDAIRFHHAPNESACCLKEGTRMAHVVAFANEFAKAMEMYTDSGWHGDMAATATALGFDFTETDIATMAENLRFTVGDELQVFSGD